MSSKADDRRRREAALEERARGQINKLIARTTRPPAPIVEADQPPEDEALSTCAACDAPIGHAEFVEKTTQSDSWGAERKLVRLHKTCWEAHITKRQDEDVARRRDGLDARFERSTTRPGTFFPRWPFARFDNAEFRRRVSPVLLQASENYSPQEDGNLVKSAPTGSGKSSLSVASLYALYERAKLGTVPGKTGDFLDFAFVTAPELVQSRRQTRLGSGDEAKLVDLAMTISLLVLDEVGFELPSEVVFDVLDRRLRALSPTILTTGLRPKEFRERYGEALWRRIAEQGAVFEDW